jgi:hypothetical protein
MRAFLVTVGVLLLGAVTTLTASATNRPDAIWARNTADLGAPVLDGVLNEPAWATAESLKVVYGKDAGIPGSGWKLEAGMATPNDSLKATLKFLVSGDYLYLGAEVKDRFVGGSKDWERFDGLLMSLKNHADPGAPKPPVEYFYSWWRPETTDPQPPGQLPAFAGRWAEYPPGTPRTPEQIANWDAATVVHGISNSDAAFDQGYTVEMRFKLSVLGYLPERIEGDIIEWNISFYDCDGYWPISGSYFCATRTWVQSPWGNAAWYGEMRIWTRPDVTVYSPTVPSIDPEVAILNAAAYPAPTIDGQLSEAAWGVAFPKFDIRYDDNALRQTYPYVGRWRAGQFEWTPPRAPGDTLPIPVLDPADATVSMFFKGTKLYLGFDVRDQIVQYHANINRWDGFIVTINDRVVRNPDNALQGRRLAWQIGPTGQAIPSDYLLTMVQAGTAQVAATLKPGTDVDTTDANVDTGYYGEMSVDLTGLGYPPDLGDGALFIGVTLLDGDSFIPASKNYGTRTWWYREYEGECCPAWAYLDPTLVTAVDPSLHIGDATRVLQSHPNPGTRTTIEYMLAQGGAVSLEVYDAQGRLVERRSLGAQPAGSGQIEFDGRGRPAGIYLYQVQVVDPTTGTTRPVGNGRMIILD